MPRPAPYGFGFKREIHNIPLAGFLNTTSQVNRVLSLAIGYAFELVAVSIVPTVVGTGAGASRVINVRKGSATGTIVGTVTATLANQGTLGVITTGTVTTTSGTNVFNDQGATPDTLTIELPTGGTVFSAGGLDLVLLVRSRLQRAS